MIHDHKPPLDEALLIHYGVKGMQWGVINENRTASRDARREKRVAKFESKAEVFNTKISELQIKNEALAGSYNPVKMYQRTSNNAMTKQYTQERDRALRDAEAVQKGKLTSNQKLVIGGAVAAAAILAAIAVHQGKESGALNAMVLKGQAFVKGEKVPFKTDHSLSGRMSPEDILKKVSGPVNPNYKSAGGQMNCRRSTFAHELRRRGFDVSATTAAKGTGQSESGFINAVTPGSKKFIDKLSVTDSVQKAEREFVKKASESTDGIVDLTTRMSSKAEGDKRSNPITKVVLNGLKVGRAQSLEDFDRGLTTAESSSKAIMRELQKQPNGARGEVLLNFGSFGHSMAYEVVDGQAHLFDSQKAKLYNALNPVEGKWDGFNSAEITRLDNVDLDLNFLARWATNRG